MEEWYKKHKKVLNYVLVGIFILLSGTYVIQTYIYDLLLQNADKLSKISSLLRDAFYMLAIFIAGLWTYYIFIKGRTFEPKAKLVIGLKDLLKEKNIAIVRFTVINIGKVKLTSLRGQARYFLVNSDQQGILYIPYGIDVDILRNYREFNEDIVLEPGDEINIDMPLLVKGVENSALMVKSVFEVSESRAYKENTVFLVQQEGS